MLNQINLKALEEYTEIIKENPLEAISSYGITATWRGGVETEIRTFNQKVGSKEIIKNFNYTIGEPEELLGNNQNPTPQDFLLGDMAGCMMVGFVILATNKGIKLENVELKISGDLNLRGMLELDSDVSIGFAELQFLFHGKGSGTQEEYDEIIKHVQKISPNYRTISDPVKIIVNKNIKQ
jgi:uncharacterized OsmC-like protein